MYINFIDIPKELKDKLSLIYSKDSDVLFQEYSNERELDRLDILIKYKNRKNIPISAESFYKLRQYRREILKFRLLTNKTSMDEFKKNKSKYYKQYYLTNKIIIRSNCLNRYYKNKKLIS